MAVVTSQGGTTLRRSPGVGGHLNACRLGTGNPAAAPSVPAVQAGRADAHQGNAAQFGLHCRRQLPDHGRHRVAPGKADHILFPDELAEQPGAGLAHRLKRPVCRVRHHPEFFRSEQCHQLQGLAGTGIDGDGDDSLLADPLQYAAEGGW